MAFEDQQVLSSNRTENSENGSEEESRQEDQMAWEELSIMERLSSNSVDMTEEELETAFSQLSLAFRCDQYTLCQRLEAEEHARDKAEDNLKLEVERGMEMLETLKGMCLDIKRARLLQQLELCLSIIGGTIGRISSTAEVLGAVHKEAKVSRAVELMVAHVENLKCRHERNSAELEEIKKQVEKSSIKEQACEQREEIEATEKMEKESQKPHLRRRISMNVISKQDQRQKVKEPQATTFSVSNDNNEVRESSTNKPDQTEDCLQMDRRQVFPEENSLQTADNKAPKETSSLASAQTHSKQIPRYETDPHCVNKNASSPVALHHQRRKAAGLERSHAWLKRSESYLRNCDRCVISLQRPLMQWLYHCRWLILVIYLIVLCSVIILAILVWFLQTPVLWM